MGGKIGRARESLSIFESGLIKRALFAPSQCSGFPNSPSLVVFALSLLIL